MAFPLADIDQPDASRRVEALVEQSDLNGALASLDARIVRLESEHGLLSEAMRSQVVNGALEESDEICTWLMLLNRRTRLERRLRDG